MQDSVHAQHITLLRKFYPNFTDDELEEIRIHLAAYIRLSCSIYDAVIRDPERRQQLEEGLARLRSQHYQNAVLKRRKKFEVGNMEEVA